MYKPNRPPPRESTPSGSLSSLAETAADSRQGGTRKRLISGLSLILGLGLLLRMGAGLGLQYYVSQTPGRLCLIAGDAEGYWELARNLVTGRGYTIYDPPRRVLRMPGFSMMLAVGMKLLQIGETPTFWQMVLIRWGLAVVGTAACAVVYLLGRDLFDRQVGLWGCAIAAFSPIMVGFSVLLLTETTFALCLTLSVWALVRLYLSQGTPREFRQALLAGAGAALATLIRPTWIIVPSIWTFCSWLFADRVWNVLRQGFWLHLALAVVLSPWIIRNYVVTGHVIATTLWSGPSLYDGLHPQATGESDMTFLDRDGVYQRMSEYDADRYYSQLAKDYLQDTPRHAVQLAISKASRYWSLWPNANQFQHPLLRWGGFFSIFPPLLLAMWGTRTLLYQTTRGPSRFVASGILWGPIILFSLIHLIYVGSLRYRLPAEYPLFVLSGFGLREMISLLRRERV